MYLLFFWFRKRKYTIFWLLQLSPFFAIFCYFLLSVYTNITTQKQYDQEYAEEVQNIRNKQVDATTPDGSGTVTSGNWVNFVPKKLGPLTISGTGSIRSVADLQNGNYQIVAYNPDSNLDKSHIITHVVWGNIAPQLISGSLEAGNGPDNTYSTPGTEVWHVTSGSVIRIPQSLYTMDGTVHDVIIKIESGGDALSNNIVTIWNQNNAINYTQVGNGNTKNNNYITVSYGVDTLDNSEPYLWLNAEADLDVQQRITVGGGDNVQTLSVGGNLQYDATNGYAKVKSLPGADLSGFDSAPDGIVVYAAYATNLVKTISDDGSPQAYAIADADFGISLDLNYVEHKATSVSYHYLVLAIFLIYCRFFPYSYSVLLEMRRTISWLSIHVIHYFTNTMTTGLVYIRSVQYGQLLSIRIG